MPPKNSGGSTKFPGGHKVIHRTAQTAFVRVVTPRLCFLDSQRNIELETSRHEFADTIHQNKQEFDGQKRSEGKTGRKSSPFQEHVAQSSAIGDLHAQILSVSLLQFSRLFCLLSSQILQNSFLDLYLVDIRRHKHAFFAKILRDSP